MYIFVILYLIKIFTDTFVLGSLNLHTLDTFLAYVSIPPTLI